MNHDVRCIRGLVIERHWANGSILWQAVERKPPTETQSYDERTGEKIVMIMHHDPRVTWSDSLDLEAVRARYAHIRFRELNPYEPDPEHDEYEQLLNISTFFAAKFAAQFKIKSREPIGTLPLGTVKISLSCGHVRCDDTRARELLRSHANGHWGEHGDIGDHQELTEDQRWCPPLFGQGTTNAIAVADGAGIVRSVYEIPAETRHAQAECVEIVTLLEHERVETLIISRRFDI
jgi:hypothetical protein